jgi:hypothetical protein
VTVDDRGTDQDSVISPILANIYLHYITASTFGLSDGDGRRPGATWLIADMFKEQHPDAHGQGIALAATRLGIAATIVAPYGNSVEKNDLRPTNGIQVNSPGAGEVVQWRAKLELVPPRVAIRITSDEL